MNKILIVDDQPYVRELLKVTLELDDYYQLIFADNGCQALRLAQSKRPDVILLDIMMPDSEIDGLDVCRRLKADPVTANISIIVLSAKGQKEDVEAGMAAGADDYVVKPFSPVALLNRIETELRKKNDSGIFYNTVSLLCWT